VICFTVLKLNAIEVSYGPQGLLCFKPHTPSNMTQIFQWHLVLSSKRSIKLQMNRCSELSSESSVMMEAVRTSETSVDNHFTRQYIPEDNSGHHTRRRENLISDIKMNRQS
jgi:hypothetical protein